MSAYEPAYYVPEEEHKKQKPNYGSIYMITHIIISFFAIYLSWRCNGGFNVLHFFAALLCPYLYIIWALATRGGCGVFDISSDMSELSGMSRITLSSTSPMQMPMNF